MISLGNVTCYQLESTYSSVAHSGSTDDDKQINDNKKNSRFSLVYHENFNLKDHQNGYHSLTETQNGQQKQDQQQQSSIQKIDMSDYILFPTLSDPLIVLPLYFSSSTSFEKKRMVIDSLRYQLKFGKKLGIEYSFLLLPDEDCWSLVISSSSCSSREDDKHHSLQQQQQREAEEDAFKNLFIFVFNPETGKYIQRQCPQADFFCPLSVVLREFVFFSSISKDGFFFEDLPLPNAVKENSNFLERVGSIWAHLEMTMKKNPSNSPMDIIAPYLTSTNTGMNINNFIVIKKHLLQDTKTESKMTFDMILSNLLSIGSSIADQIDGIFSHGKFSFVKGKLEQNLNSAWLNRYYHIEHQKNVLERNLSVDSIRFDTIEDAIHDIKQGKFVIVVDNEDRENEGDLIIAAEDVTAEKMAFMIRYSSGVICVPTTSERLEHLQLPLMVENNEDSLKTAYTISVDYKHGTTTGISATDRALTIANMANPNNQPQDFTRPGHVFPLRYVEGGVMKRVGHTEASVDLCKLAGKQPCAAISEIVLDDGRMARRDDLFVMAKVWGLKMITIDQLRKYIIENKKSYL